MKRKAIVIPLLLLPIFISIAILSDDTMTPPNSTAHMLEKIQNQSLSSEYNNSASCESLSFSSNILEGLNEYSDGNSVPASGESDASSMNFASGYKHNDSSFASSKNTVSSNLTSSKNSASSSAASCRPSSSGVASNYASSNPPSSSCSSSGTASTGTSSHIHSYTSKVTAATCTSQGYTTHACSCGDSYKDTYVSAKGHSYSAWTVTKAATTTSTGTETRTCTRSGCSASETRSTAKLDKYSVAASEATAGLLQERILYYINLYRNEQGSVTATTLPKQQAYAEYRAKQLTTNFAHDAMDEQAAAEALQYGKYYSREYLDSINCPDDPPFWCPICGEAIGCAERYQGDNVDVLAKRIAAGFKNSSGHWAYVGNTANKYITVGVAFANGNCYVAVVTNNTNIYG